MSLLQRKDDDCLVKTRVAKKKGGVNKKTGVATRSGERVRKAQEDGETSLSVGRQSKVEIHGNDNQ